MHGHGYKGAERVERCGTVEVSGHADKTDRAGSDAEHLDQVVRTPHVQKSDCGAEQENIECARWRHTTRRKPGCWEIIVEKQFVDAQVPADDVLANRQ